jgi:hypothetical protein
LLPPDKRSVLEELEEPVSLEVVRRRRVLRKELCEQDDDKCKISILFRCIVVVFKRLVLFKKCYLSINFIVSFTKKNN